MDIGTGMTTVMQKPFLLTLEYPPQIGGVAKYLEGEVNNFAGDVVVARAQTMMWPSATRSHPQPKAKGGGGWLPLLWRPRPNYKKQGCDGLWVSHILPIGYIGLVWKWLFRTPYRVYVHGLDLVRPQRSPWKKFWARQILSAADEIVANSNATAQLLINYGVAPARARIRYPRLEKRDPAAYYETGRQLRQKYGIADKPVLLTISRLVKRKGINLVLQALPLVWRQIPDLVYVVVGAGEERERLSIIASEVPRSGMERSNSDARAINFGIASVAPQDAGLPRNDMKIILTGAVSEQEKYGWLSACDCFILTPINDPNDFEGYGIVYKEAQMFNKPVIGSRVNGVPEAVGESGILVEPGDIEQIIKAVITVCHSRESGNPGH